MSKVYLDDSILTAIANAIRTQGNTRQTFYPYEMPSAIEAIDTSPSTLATIKKVAPTRVIRWPGWEDATWVDIKLMVDDVARRSADLPSDIEVGRVKLCKIGDMEGVCELCDIIDGVLLFKVMTPRYSTASALEDTLYDLFIESEHMHCLTNDKLFALSEDRELLTDEEEKPYTLMFAIGPRELGPEYTGRYEEEQAWV